MNAVTANILLWHYYNREAFCKGTPHGESKSVVEGYGFLKNNGFLFLSQANPYPQCGLTEKGEAMVEEWISVLKGRPHSNTIWRPATDTVDSMVEQFEETLSARFPFDPSKAPPLYPAATDNGLSRAREAYKQALLGVIRWTKWAKEEKRCRE